jgi:hypothetical protein
MKDSWISSPERLPARLPYISRPYLSVFAPFDLDYRPDRHSVGEAAIREAFEQAKAGAFPKMFAYQRGAWFIISDDYIPLFAAITGYLGISTAPQLCSDRLKLPRLQKGIDEPVDGARHMTSAN